MIPPQKKVIHEYRGNKQHRIVIIENDRRREGPWTAFKNFAHLAGFHATTSYWEGQLPVGVFRLNPIPHEVVDDVNREEPS